jgi:hypothetical protein
MKKKQWRKLWMRGRSDVGFSTRKFQSFFLNASHQTIMMGIIEEESSLR